MVHNLIAYQSRFVVYFLFAQVNSKTKSQLCFWNIKVKSCLTQNYFDCSKEIICVITVSVNLSTIDNTHFIVAPNNNSFHYEQLLFHQFAISFSTYIFQKHRILYWFFVFGVCFLYFHLSLFKCGILFLSCTVYVAVLCLVCRWATDQYPTNYSK